eukprot:g14274.t1
MLPLQRTLETTILLEVPPLIGNFLNEQISALMHGVSEKLGSLFKQPKPMELLRGKGKGLLKLLNWGNREDGVAAASPPSDGIQNSASEPKFVVEPVSRSTGFLQRLRSGAQQLSQDTGDNASQRPLTEAEMEAEARRIMQAVNASFEGDPESHPENLQRLLNASLRKLGDRSPKSLAIGLGTVRGVPPARMKELLESVEAEAQKNDVLAKLEATEPPVTHKMSPTVARKLLCDTLRAAGGFHGDPEPPEQHEPQAAVRSDPEPPEQHEPQAAAEESASRNTTITTPGPGLKFLYNMLCGGDLRAEPSEGMAQDYGSPAGAASPSSFLAVHGFKDKALTFGQNWGIDYLSGLLKGMKSTITGALAGGIATFIVRKVIVMLASFLAEKSAAAASTLLPIAMPVAVFTGVAVYMLTRDKMEGLEKDRESILTVLWNRVTNLIAYARRKQQSPMNGRKKKERCLQASPRAAVPVLILIPVLELDLLKRSRRN